MNYVFATLVGLIVGMISMAIMASGGKVDEIEKNTILRMALINVFQWNRNKRQSVFPEREIIDALKMD